MFKSKKSNQIIKTCIFLLIFSILFSISSEVIFPKWGGKTATRAGIRSFYQLDDDSLDVLFIGSSSFRNGVSPLLLWQQKGFTSYVRATGNQQSLVSYYYLKEALTITQPKVLVLDTITLFYNFGIDEKETSLRRSVDPMRFSLVKLELINDIISRSEKQTFISYLFPLLRYHSRWNNLQTKDFKYHSFDQDPNHRRGQYITYQITPVEIPDEYMQTTNENEAISDISVEFFEKMIDLCREENIQIMFVSLPRLGSYTTFRHDEIQKFADQHGIPFIDYNSREWIEEIGLDVENDFSDINHVNIYGAIKISEIFANDITEQFDLEDKRDNPIYENWNDDLQDLLVYIEENKEKNQ